MNRIATLQFNTNNNKWEAVYERRILASSNNKDYVIKMIREGRCARANVLKVDDVMEAGGQMSVSSPDGSTQEITERFNINERFGFLTDFVTMVAEKVSPSIIVTGEGGLGKTFTVMAALAEAGFKDSADVLGHSIQDPDDEDFDGDFSEKLEASKSKNLYTVVKGYSTAKGLYRTLYENRHRIVVFDDCDSVLRDPVALNLLKGALDSYEKRRISWNSEGFIDDGLPKSFEFKGGVIFISNMPTFKIDQAVRTRSINVDLSMNTDQKLERMAEIIKSEEFLPNFSTEHKIEALEFIRGMKDEAREISFRTLISVTKVAQRGGNWKRRAEYLLTATN